MREVYDSKKRYGISTGVILRMVEGNVTDCKLIPPDDNDQFQVFVEFSGENLGNMMETQLYGWLQNRPLLGCSATEVLASLQTSDNLTVWFENLFRLDKPIRVMIQRL
jgi:hypothetical protein